MRRDLLTGMVLSVIIHGGFVTISQLYREGPLVKIKAIEPAVVRITMPPLDLDKPEPTDSKEPDPTPVFTAPVQPELIPAPQPESFVQLAQTPVLDGPRAVTVNIPDYPARVERKNSLEIFDPSRLDQQPKPTYQAKPLYPYDQRRMGTTGQVMVGFVVDAAGNVQDVYAMDSTQREFESAAVQAVSKWKFKPGRRGGAAVATRMQVPVVFSISDGM